MGALTHSPLLRPRFGSKLTPRVAVREFPFAPSTDRSMGSCAPVASLALLGPSRTPRRGLRLAGRSAHACRDIAASPAAELKFSACALLLSFGCARQLTCHSTHAEFCSFRRL